MLLYFLLPAYYGRAFFVLIERKDAEKRSYFYYPHLADNAPKGQRAISPWHRHGKNRGMINAL